MTIDEFINLPENIIGYTKWLELPLGEVYVRIGNKFINDEIGSRWTLQIANVEFRIDARGQGRFTRWLTEVERLAFAKGYAVFIENVSEENDLRFQRFFERNGYIKWMGAYSYCCYKLPK